jgi:hypothetical protein
LHQRRDAVDRGPIEAVSGVSGGAEEHEIKRLGKETTLDSRVSPELDRNERRPVEALSEARRTEELMDAAPLRVTSANRALTKKDVGFLEPPFMSFAGFVPESARSGIAARPEELDETIALLFAFESDELRALPRRDQVVDLVLEEAIGGKGEGQEKKPGETAREASHLRDDTMGRARTVWYSTTWRA